MSARHTHTSRWLNRLHEAAQAVERPLQFMEVCGTHTMSAFRCGLQSLMPKNVTLLSGPGCPVCVTAQSDIDQMIQLGLDRDVTLCTYGDMLRIPGRHGSLERARSKGADIRVVYSTLDAVALAAREPQRQIVFAAVGFETTAPATAAALLRAQQFGLDNFSVLTSHKRVLPAMETLLASGEMKLDGFLCPGHVSVIIGAAAYRPIVETYRQSCVITGFEDAQMAAGLARLVELCRDDQVKLINEYPQAVTQEGNPAALSLLDQVFTPAPMRWRGLGVLPNSGLILRDEFANYDAATRFALTPLPECEPAKCLCGKVISGCARPNDCELFGTSCTPIHPIGPCMVSSEGTCQAWFKYHRHTAPTVPMTVDQGVCA